MRSSGTLPTRTIEYRSRRGEVDSLPIPLKTLTIKYMRSSGGIGRRVGLKIQSGE